MPDVTRRFRAASSIPYARALIALVQHARVSTDDFAFGPVGNVSALLNNGLTVTGPETVLKTISDLLDRDVPGLYETED